MTMDEHETLKPETETRRLYRSRDVIIFLHVIMIAAVKVIFVANCLTLVSPGFDARRPRCQKTQTQTLENIEAEEWANGLGDNSEQRCKLPRWGSRAAKRF